MAKGGSASAGEKLRAARPSLICSSSKPRSTKPWSPPAADVPRRNRSPRRVVTVTQDEIRIHGWRSLAEVLASVPGLYVIDDLVLPAVSVRGASGGLNAGTRIVKVMIDGTVVDFRPDLTAFLGPEFIPIEVVERVGIARARCPPSTARMPSWPPSTSSRAKAPRGQRRLRPAREPAAQPWQSGRFRHRQLSQRALLRHGGGQRRSQRSLRPDAGSHHPTADPQNALFTRESQNDIASPISAYLHLGGESERLGRLSFQAGLQRLNSAGEFRINSLFGHASNIAYVNLWNALRYDKQWTKFELAAALGYAYGSADGEHRLGLTGNPRYSFRPNVDYHAVNGSLAGTYNPFGELLAIRLGLDFEYSRATSLYYTQTFLQAESLRKPGDQVDLIDSPDQAKLGSYDVGAFLHVNSAPIRRLPGLRLTGDDAARQDRHRPAEYDPQISFRAAIAYRFTPASSPRSSLAAPSRPRRSACCTAAPASAVATTSSATWSPPASRSCSPRPLTASKQHSVPASLATSSSTAVSTSRASTKDRVSADRSRLRRCQSGPDLQRRLRALHEVHLWPLCDWRLGHLLLCICGCDPGQRHGSIAKSATALSLGHGGIFCGR